MMNRYSANPAPVFGEHVYTDPLYRFQLDVFDGMDFSEWMEWDDVDVKLGVDTNVFKTDADRPTQDGSMLAAALLEYAQLYNFADGRYAAALRFIRRLGGTFDETVCQTGCAPFLRFTFRRK